MNNLATKETDKITIEDSPPITFWADKSYVASWCAVDEVTVDGVIYALKDKLYSNRLGQFQSNSLFSIIDGLDRYGYFISKVEVSCLVKSGIYEQFGGKHWITRKEAAESAGISTSYLDKVIKDYENKITLTSNGDLSTASFTYLIRWLGKSNIPKAYYSYLILGDLGTRVRLAKLAGYEGSLV